MKKRLLSTVMTLAMLLCLMPTNAWAASYRIQLSIADNSSPAVSGSARGDYIFGSTNLLQQLYQLFSYDELADKFSGTGLGSVVRAGEVAYTSADADAWEDYIHSQLEPHMTQSSDVALGLLKSKTSTVSQLARLGRSFSFVYDDDPNDNTNRAYTVTLTLSKQSGDDDDDMKFATKRSVTLGGAEGDGTVTVTNRDTGAKIETVTKTDEKTGSKTVTVTDTDRHGNQEIRTSVTEKKDDKEVTTTTVTDRDGNTSVTVTEKESRGNVTVEHIYEEEELVAVITTTTEDNTATAVEEDPEGNEVKTTVTTVRGDTTTETMTNPAGDKIVTVSVNNSYRQTVTQTQELANGVTVRAKVSSDKDAEATITVPQSAVEGSVGSGNKVPLSIPAGDGNLVIETLADGTERPIEYAVVKEQTAYLLVDSDSEIRIDYKADLFDDMKTSWAHDASDFTGGRRIFVGTPEGLFEPAEGLTRAMFVTVLHRLERTPEAITEHSFEDVSDGKWYSDAITWGYENKVITGFTDTNFGPTDLITREQFAVMLFRYSDVCDYELSGEAELKFSDWEKTSRYAQLALDWAVTKGLLNGYPDGTVRPTDTITRAQSAIVMQRFIENAVYQSQT